MEQACKGHMDQACKGHMDQACNHYCSRTRNHMRHLKAIRVAEDIFHTEQRLCTALQGSKWNVGGARQHRTCG